MTSHEEASNIWRHKVPAKGQSYTVEGELIRGIEKLRWEAQNNGNGNWDQGFEIILAFLRSILVEEAPDAAHGHKVEVVLRGLSRFDYPTLEDEPYDYLTDQAVEWFRAHGTRVHKHNPALLR